MANPSIPAELLEELNAAMGKPLPEEAKERMAYWKTLRQDHPALASQLLGYIRPGRTALVSAVEQERQKVGRREHWHNLLRGTLYQENLSSENVPNRKRLVILIAGAFVAMVGISVVLYSTQPKTDVKLGSPVAAAANSVLPRENPATQPQDQPVPDQTQQLPGTSQSSGPSAATASSEPDEGLPDSLIPKASGATRGMQSNPPSTQTAVEPAPLVEWSTPPTPPTIARPSYGGPSMPRTASAYSSYPTPITVPPNVGRTSGPPTLPDSRNARVATQWNPGVSASGASIAAPSLPANGTVLNPSGLRPQGAGVIQNPDQLTEQTQLSSVDVRRPVGVAGEEPMVMTRVSDADRAPVGRSDSPVVASKLNPPPPLAEVATNAQKSSSPVPQQTLAVMVETKDEEVRSSEPWLASRPTDEPLQAVPGPLAQTAPTLEEGVYILAQPTHGPEIAQNLKNAQPLISQPIPKSQTASSTPKSQTASSTPKSQTASSTPKSQTASSVQEARQTMDDSPLIAVRKTPGQPYSTSARTEEAEEVWVASRQPLAREGGVVSAKAWPDAVTNQSTALRSGPTGDVPIAEPFAAQRVPATKPTTVGKTNPADSQTLAKPQSPSSVVNPATPQSPKTLTSPPDGTLLEGTLLTSIVTAEGASIPVIAQSELGNWIGTASLSSLGRVTIRFHQLVGAEGSIKVAASAFDTEGVPGVGAALEDQSPALAADLLRAGVSGFSTFAQSLLQAGNTSVSGGVVVKEQKVPPLEYILGGEIAKLFQLPTAHQSVVRVARVPKGSPILIAVGVSAEGLEDR